MDPNNLDPKLKATYDRVMGTPTAPGQPGAAPVPQPAAPVAPPVNAVNPVISTTPQVGGDATQPASPTPAAAFTADNLSFQAAIQTPVAQGTQITGVGQTVPQQTSFLLKFLYIVGAVIFFVIYTLVWVKIFNLPLPF